MSEIGKCELCGEAMPRGEEMFKFHGYSSKCPKPPMVEPIEVWTDRVADDLRGNIVLELEQKGLKGQEVGEAIRHIMIFIRQWLRNKK